MTKFAVLTSGGDAPGMNSAVRAIAKICAGRGVEVVGAELGYEGLIDGNLRPLTLRREDGLTTPSEIDRCGGWGGTILGSARSTRFRTSEGRAQAAATIAEHGIDGLVIIGGNGSLTGASILSAEHGTPVVGIPASIDNDIGCTGSAIGVDTALNTIIDACDRISDTASAHRRAFVVEVMGRDCGYLAMASAIAAGADAVLMREQDRGEDGVIDAVEQTIRSGFERGKQRVLIIKSEGVSVPCTRLVRELNARIEGDHVRATVLGHVVRGGRPSYEDRRIANRLAFQAVQALSAGKVGTMTAWRPTVKNVEKTVDPSVALVPLSEMIAETQKVLEGTSMVMKWRLQMMEHVAGVLGV
ncbi:MAG: 6-phosphofructokinase [Myxococcota bacterium]